jgi:hypothetical protein
MRMAYPQNSVQFVKRLRDAYDAEGAGRIQYGRFKYSPIYLRPPLEKQFVNKLSPIYLSTPWEQGKVLLRVRLFLQSQNRRR